MNKRLYGRKRSAPSLLASGAATLSFDQGIGRIRVKAAHKALRDDQKAIAGDARRAYTRLLDELETA